MPYSDNMSSMNEDSDGEDYESQLSPSDGQFPSSSSNETPHIPNIFIPDSTFKQRTERRAVPKVQEADEDRLLSSQTDPSRHSWESSFQSSSRLEQAVTATTEVPPPHHREVTYSQSSASQSSSQALSSRAWSPSVYSEAPPAYSPSLVSSIPSGSARRDNRSRNYNTFGINRIMGTPGVEGERLLGYQPESMSAPVEEANGTPAWARRVRRRLPAWFNWKYGLLALVVLAVSIALLSGISFASSHPSKGNDSTQHPAKPVDKEPEIQVPDGSESPGLPIQETFCRGEQHHYDDQVLPLDFQRLQNLTFRETEHQHSGSSVRVGGRVNVRRLTEGGGDPRMVLEIVTNEPNLRLYTSLDAGVQEIKISVPKKYESSIPGQRPCVEIKGTVWVPGNAEIGILSLRAIHLDILLLDDLSLHVADYTELSSVVGDIKAGASQPTADPLSSNPDYTFVPAKDSWAFDSRIIEVHTTSGDIDGNWPLYDMLGLHTTSGSIKVSITPEEELENYPKPAVLSLSTISGVISATEPIHELNRIPPRDYLVDVKTASGSVHSALAFSTGITVHSTASNLALELLPVINIDKITPENPAQLETITTSGGIAIRVLEPKFYDDNGKALEAETATPASVESNVNTTNDMPTDAALRALDCLAAKHTSTSGNISLRYPQSWEGILSAETTSGRLVAKGKDLKIIKSSGGWPGSKLEARKGAAGKKSTIELHALLGSLDALIGDES